MADTLLISELLIGAPGANNPEFIEAAKNSDNERTRARVNLMLSKELYRLTDR